MVRGQVAGLMRSAHALAQLVGVGDGLFGVRPDSMMSIPIARF